MNSKQEQKNTPKRILVRSPNWIGDQILAYPFFYYLRKMYPRAHIAVNCVKWVEDIQYLNLVNEVIPLTPTSIPKGFAHSPGIKWPKWLTKWKALERGVSILQRQGPWDLGICLPNSFSSAWLLYRSRAKIRRGYSADGRRLLLNEALEVESSVRIHRAEAYVRLLMNSLLLKKPVREFWGAPAENELDPDVPGVLKNFDAERAWPRAEPVDPPQEAYWVLAPGSNAESRRWPIEKFSQLAKKIHTAKGWPGIIIGGPAESSLASALRENRSLNLKDWTGRGSVSRYWKVFQNAQFSVCNDSGLAHVAALCGSPVHVIWGAGNPKKTEPLGPGRVRVLFNPVECWPCESNFCNQIQDLKLNCLKGISADTVWEEIQSGIRL